MNLPKAFKDLVSLDIHKSRVIRALNGVSRSIYRTEADEYEASTERVKWDLPEPVDFELASLGDSQELERLGEALEDA